LALQSTTALATVTLQAATPTVTFSGIPQGYRDLILVVEGKIQTAFGDVKFYFNGVQTGYSNVQMSGSGSATSSQTLDTDAIRFNFYAGFNNSQPGIMIANIMDYSVTDKHKTAIGRQSTAVGGSFQGSDAGAGRWASTSAITSITIRTNSPEYSPGATFSLYGRIA
jgi:hypothetical protein